eukprot:Lithocolla_globosa_v1_NODE_1378_length_2621_cov_6.806703.p1 type:complete len:444 gc:universal NODE_1378_length_2621_cov_6.806703:1096-2427(+)
MTLKLKIGQSNLKIFFSVENTTVSIMRRVVVTGLGLVTPLGVGVEETWKKLIEGNSAIQSTCSLPGMDVLPCTVAGLVSSTFAEHSKSTSTVPMATRYALVAAQEALNDANWNPTEEDFDARLRTGVCIGSGIGSMSDTTAATLALQKSYRKVSPFFVPKILVNMASGHVSITHGFHGPLHSVSTACATGAHALGDAARFIQYGDADVMVAGATEASIDLLSMTGFCRLRALSTGFNKTPELASRPFDKDRDGFVMGEGAGVVVLEEYEHAKRRNARIYAELAGYGLSGDAHHITAPREDGLGATLAMQRAMKHAKIATTDVGYVNAHATSTPIGDLAENRAIKKVFSIENGKNESTLAVSSTKGATGHLLGAAGSVEAIFTILAVTKGQLPPTCNLEQVEDENVFNLNYVPKITQKRNLKAALSNSFGFGGTNVTLAFLKPS